LVPINFLNFISELPKIGASHMKKANPFPPWEKCFLPAAASQTSWHWLCLVL